ATRGHRRLVERVHLRARPRAERDVNRRNIGRAFADPEIGLRRDAEAGEAFPFHQRFVAERLQRGPIEGLALRDVRNADAGMVDHLKGSYEFTRPQTKYSSSAFCACRRFSASSHTTLWGPSITSASTSSPRCAGRQGMKSRP